MNATAFRARIELTVLTNDQLKAAHNHSIRNHDEIQRSKICGCFYCLETYAPAALQSWITEPETNERTAECPHCGIDSVIGDAAGFDLSPEFLRAMHKAWFEDPRMDTD